MHPAYPKKCAYVELNVDECKPLPAGYLVGGGEYEVKVKVTSFMGSSAVAARGVSQSAGRAPAVTVAAGATAVTAPVGAALRIRGRGLHSFTLELNLSNSRTHS